MDQSRRFVVDAQPFVGAFKGEPIRPIVARIVAEALEGRFDLRVTSVNAGEIVYGVERYLGAESGHEALERIQDWLDVVPVDLELAVRAGWFKLRGGISYADCFAAALAHRDGVPLITGDQEFHRVEDIVQIAWLDSFG